MLAIDTNVIVRFIVDEGFEAFVSFDRGLAKAAAKLTGMRVRAP